MNLEKLDKIKDLDTNQGSNSKKTVASNCKKTTYIKPAIKKIGSITKATLFIGGSSGGVE
jgi:hypothetical protein